MARRDAGKEAVDLRTILPGGSNSDAICAACGTPTTVPFEPRQGREVYCRECFQHLHQDDR
jgi:CxxC-x17-CxxC domain-containing protein